MTIATRRKVEPSSAPARSATRRTSPSSLAETVERTVTGLGFALADLEVGNRGAMVRVFIDRPDVQDPQAGITLHDCELVSRQLQHVLAVEEIDYGRLEVSSPGLDRVLKKPADFKRFVGFAAELRLRVPRGNRRRFSGRLRGASEQSVEMEVDGAIETFALTELDRARLVPEIGGAAARRVIE